jgi:hypothetical protein
MKSEIISGVKLIEMNRQKVNLFVPSMRSDNQDGFETFASSFYPEFDNLKFQAFNDDPFGGYGWFSDDYPPQFIGNKLPSPKIANFMTIQSSGDYWEHSPQSFRIESSNDGIFFIILAEFSTYFTDINQTRNFKFNNKLPFIHYRIYIKSVIQYGYFPGCKHLNFGFIE